MRVWTCLLTVSAVLAMSSSGLGQRTGQPSTGGGGRNTGGGGGQTAGGGGAAGAGTSGFGIGGAIDQNLQNPDSVFEIDRGNTIGASAANVQSFSAIGTENTAGTGAGGLGGAFGGGFGGMGGLGGMFGGGNRQGGVQEQESARRIRTRLRADIRGPNVPSPQVEAQIQNRWAKLPSQPRFRGVDVEMRGRTAVLHGEVGTPEDRRMAELMLRLEPGVSQIQNQLLVTSEMGDDPAAPPVPIPRPPANEIPLE